MKVFAAATKSLFSKLMYLFVALLVTVSPSFIFAQDTRSITAEAFRVVNVRSGPSIDNPIIAQLESGDVVTVVARSNSESDWLQIELDGQLGWVAYFVVTLNGDTSTLPIIEGDGLAVDGEETLLVLLPNAPSPSTTSNVTATAYRRANLRSDPATSAPVIGQLNPGDVITVIARNSSESEWLQVEFNGQEGWVAYFLVSVEGDLESIPIIETGVLDPTSAPELGSVSVRTRYNANLRNSPSLDAEVLTVIPFGSTLTASSRTQDGWLQVTYQGQIGWILRSLVAVLAGEDEESLTIGT